MLADANGTRHEATRALVNLAYTLMCWGRPLEARTYVEEAITYAGQHEVHTLAEYARTMLAWLGGCGGGEWDEAERVAARVVSGGESIPQLLARTVLTELAIRRGDPDAAGNLAGLAAQAERTGELQRLAPVVELQVESALLGGSPMPCAAASRSSSRRSGACAGTSRVGARCGSRWRRRWSGSTWT